jgi:DNA polymerase elongation subunit (family B)
MKPRVLTLDIETSPHLAYTYDLFDARITPDKIVTPSRVLCWAGKWLGESKVHFYSEYHNDPGEMIQAAWTFLNEADVLITYNGVRFDVPHLMRSFIEEGMPPPSPWIDLDLYLVNRRRYKWASNRLGYITEQLELPTKLQSGVAQLWKKVLEEDDRAWQKFKKYNCQDVVITELLYRTMAPWIKHPHIGLWTGDQSTCPACGSTQLTPTGLTYTRTGAWMKSVCECGTWCKVLANGKTRPI